MKSNMIDLDIAVSCLRTKNYKLLLKVLDVLDNGKKKMPQTGFKAFEKKKTSS